jgi:N-carbamoyl-L-amino-acid hydrolase
VISFADEEGARWGTPTFGSKALVGRLEVAEVLARRDAEGVPLADAMRAAGLDPGLVGEATTALVKLAGFIEIHIDQSTEVAEAGRPCGIVKALAARRRLELTFRGQADHAGTTPREARHDALAAAARLIVTAEDRAASVPALTVTASRLIVDPNAPTTIASRVRLWIDARAPDEEPIEQWSAELGRAVDEVGARYRVAVEVTEASRSPAVRFSQRARAELRAAAERELGAGVPEVVCYAGHDAGILAERIPAAILLVRNRQGISHAPEEAVELEDAAAAARVVARALDRLAGTSVP